MVNTIGYHYVKSTYGQWLPGDERGHWSTAWDEKIGFIEPHMLHEGDPVRQRMAEERMRHPPVRLSAAMIDAVATALRECAAKSHGGLELHAVSIVPTHVHLLIPYSGCDIDKSGKWLADQTTKAVHRYTDHGGPVWCKGKWRTFVFDRSHWENARQYIERHNIRNGLPRRPYSFITEGDPTA